jgi:putative flippase GtrA
MSKEVAIFVLIGAGAAAINVAARALFNFVVPFELAVVLAFPIALTVAFLLNRVFVFHGATGRGTARSQYARFAAVNLLSLVLVWCISVGLARIAFPAVGFKWHADAIAHMIGVLAPALTSYFAHKSYTFAQRID